MKKRLLVMILSVTIAIGAIELLAAPGGIGHCSCFDEIEASEHCIAQCTQRGSVCRGVCALNCNCWSAASNVCDCKYIYFCNDSSYGYGYADQSCPGECPPQY